MCARLKPVLALDLGAARDAVLVRRRRGGGLRDESHSLTLTGVVGVTRIWNAASGKTP